VVLLLPLFVALPPRLPLIDDDPDEAAAAPEEPASKLVLLSLR